MKTSLTDKQYRIMSVIVHGDGIDESGQRIPVDMSRLLDLLSYRTTRDSMQFSIRALVKNGLIGKDTDLRRGARRVIYKPTKLGLQLFGRIVDPAASRAHAKDDLSKFFEVENV